jgi:hypothetical protein
MFLRIDKLQIELAAMATMTTTLASTKAMINQAPPLGSLPDRKIATLNITIPRKIRRSTAARVSYQRAPQRLRRTPKLQMVMTRNAKMLM